MANPNPPITVASAIHKLQCYLMETPSTPFDLLIAASTLLSKPDYDDVVTERTIYGLCGYPLCSASLPSPSDRLRRGRFRVSLSEHKVYDLLETYSYCREECLIGSRALKGSMSDERRADVEVGKGKVVEVLRLFGYCDGEEKIEDELAKKVKNLKLEIKEKEGTRGRDVKMEEWFGAFNAIEGYIPQLDLGSKVASNLDSAEQTQGDSSSKLDFKMVPDEGKTGGVISEKPSDPMDDISEIIAKKLENVVITEKKKTNKKSKPSKIKCQAGPSSHNIGEVDNGDVGFVSSIIYGDDDPALSKTPAASNQDACSLITQQLEDVLLAEKLGMKAASKLPSQKSRKKTSKHKSNNVDFQSTIIIGDSVNTVAPWPSSVSTAYTTKQSAKGVDGDVHVKDMTESQGYREPRGAFYSDGASSKNRQVSQETGLKSSLKTSTSKRGNRSVKWADEKHSQTQKDWDTSEDMQLEDPDSSVRLASAEACAAALSQAADFVASGKAEVRDAVSGAGIVILPQPHCDEGRDSDAEEVFEFDEGVVKWPKKTVLIDTDMFDVEDSWFDTAPEGFSLKLSSFGTMWMALFQWITCSSLAYIYGHDESSYDFLLVNEREYPEKVVLRDGKSSEIRRALDGFICLALPGLVRDLKLSVPVSTLEKFVARLLDTMTFTDALPSFKTKQLQVIILLFLEALSVHRLPSLAPHLRSRNMLLQRVLDAACVSDEEYETMRDFIMPLGRVPQFSMQCGA